MTIASATSSSLCIKAGVLQRKYAFARSAAVSADVKNMVGKVSHPIGRVIGISTNSSSSPSDGKNSPRLDLYVGRKPMWYTVLGSAGGRVPNLTLETFGQKLQRRRTDFRWTP